MIRRLRRRHRLAWAVLSPIVAILLALALLSRPEPPLMDELPEPRRAAETPANDPDDQPPRNEARGSGAPPPSDAARDAETGQERADP